MDETKGSTQPWHWFPLIPFHVFTSVNPYLEHHHVCWDRSWAYSNGWIPRMLTLIGAWDYGSKRPVFRRVITA